MDLTQLRDIIETEGGKILIVEEGKPPLVVLTLEDYRKTKAFQPRMTFGAQFAAEAALPKELEEEPLKIEDLPV